MNRTDKYTQEHTLRDSHKKVEALPQRHSLMKAHQTPCCSCYQQWKPVNTNLFAQVLVKAYRTINLPISLSYWLGRTLALFLLLFFVVSVYICAAARPRLCNNKPWHESTDGCLHDFESSKLIDVCPLQWQQDLLPNYKPDPQYINNIDVSHTTGRTLG